MDDIKLLRVKATIPHLARASRRVWGYEDGKLPCERCGKKNARRNRQRTAYHNDELNFATLCADCQKENDEYWDDMWDEYYSSVL